MNRQPAESDSAVMEPSNTNAPASPHRFDGQMQPSPRNMTTARPARRSQEGLPAWAIGASGLWLSIAFVYVLLVGGVSWTSSAIGGLAAGVTAPLVVIWLIALLQMRSLEADALTGPVRRQLAALLAPGAAAEMRVRRVTQALAEQAEQLRHAATVALDDSSAAMNALTRQSDELRRLSGGAMLELGKIGKTAEQTLVHLQGALGEVNKQTGTQRERALEMVTQLEKHIQQVLTQVDRLSGNYEAKLAKLTEASDKIEDRTRVLVSLTESVDGKIEQAADGVLGDLSRLEAAVAEVGQRSAAISHLLARPVESLESASRHLDTNMRQSQEMLANATNNLEKIGDNALNRASSLVSTLSDRLSSMELVGAKLVSVGASAQADTGRYVAQIEAAAERIRVQTEQGQQQLRQALADFDDISGKAIEQSTSLVSKIASGADKLADITAQGEEKFDALSWDIENRANRIADIGKDARVQLEKARVVLDDAQDSFSNQLERLGGLNTTLADEIGRAESGARILDVAGRTAQQRASELTAASEDTRQTLSSIADLLTGQQSSVEEMAKALNTQIETLTASLASQQEAIRAASSSAATDGENTRAVLRDQMQAIAAATVEAASQLDTMQTRLAGETKGLEMLADQFGLRLSSLAAQVVLEGEAVANATRNLGSEQETLAQIADKAKADLGALHSQLSETQSGAVTAMDSVAERLAALRSEIAKADAGLQGSATQLSAGQVQLTTDSTALAESLENTLSRLEAMSSGIDSASRTLAAQGAAAGALLDQAQAQLVSASSQLKDESQTSEMAIALVGSEISVQQSKLHELKQSIAEVAAALENTRQRIEQGEGTLVQSSQRSLHEMESAIDRLDTAGSAMQAQAVQGVRTLQAAESAVVGVASTLNATTESTDERIRQLQQDMTSLQQILANLSTRSDTLAASLAQHAVQAELATGKIQGASNVAEQSSAQLMQRMAELGTVAEAQHQRLNSMVEAVAAAEASLAASGEKGQGALRATLAELAATGEQADATLAQMVERIRSAGTAVGSEAGSAQSLMTEVVEALRSTASEFTARVETAETEMAAARSSLADIGTRLGSETATLQDNIGTLASTAQTARVELENSQVAISTTGSDVARALDSLIADIERLGNVGATNTTRLNEMSASLLDGLGDLQTAGMSVASQNELLTHNLAQAERSMMDLGEQVGSVQSIVTLMTDNATNRLAQVTALFRQSVSEGEELVTSAGHRTLSQIEQQVGSVKTAVSEMRDHTAAHLAEVGSQFTQRVSEGESLLKATHERTLSDLQAQVGSVQSAVGRMSEDAIARMNEVGGLFSQRVKDGEQLINAATRRSLVDLEEQMKGIEASVTDMTANSVNRLAEVSSQFAQRVREGEELVTGAADFISRTGMAAREQAQLLDQSAASMEQRLLQAVANVTSRQTELGHTAEEALIRIDAVTGGFGRVIDQNTAAQELLARQADHNERVIKGLSEIAENTTVNLEQTSQRMAMLAQQAAYDSSRMVGVTERIEQQQNSVRHAASEALAVMQAVEAQLRLSGDASAGQIDAMQDKATAALLAMTERLTVLTRQNDNLMGQLRETVDRFEDATGDMRQTSHTISGDIEELGSRLHSRALDLTAAGQQFDRELNMRLANVTETHGRIENYFAGFGRQLATIDTQASGTMIDLERRSLETFGRLQLGVDQLAALPEQVDMAQSLLSTQVETARNEIAKLRYDLVEIGREVQEQVATATGASGALVANLQDVGVQSRLTAEQLDSVAQQLVSASEGAWQAVSMAVSENSSGLTGLVGSLENAEARANTIAATARGEIEAMLAKIGELGVLVEGSLDRLNGSYVRLSTDGLGNMAQLTERMEAGASRLEESTIAANGNFALAAEMLERHQVTIMEGTSQLQARLDDVRGQLQGLLDGVSGLDARLEIVSPNLGAQQARFESFLGAVDRTLGQVASLHEASRDLASEHLALAAQVQESESRLVATAGELEGRLGQLDSSLSTAVLSRLTQAAEHAQTVEGHLGRLGNQAGKLDGSLLQIRQSLEQDVQSLQQAETAISTVAERTAMKMLEVGTALNATLNQLQKGGQLSHAGLMQTNEETQRMVVRLEQVRALIKNMMGAIGTDLTDWQSDLKRKLENAVGDIAPLARVLPPPASAPQTPATLTPPRVRVAAPAVGSGLTSAQLTTEALHALAVDLYRLLHAEVPDLKQGLMPPAAKRQPMTPDDSRTYTRSLLDQKAEVLLPHVRDLYKRNFEFRQYVDRYIARFEAQYDVLARSTQGIGEANNYRMGEVGQLYELVAGALERKRLAATAQVAAS